MSRTLWAMVALLIWSAALFLAGRWTVPDRSQEVQDWRDSATVAVQRSERADSNRVAAEARTGALIERTLVAESRLAHVTARSAERGAEVAALTQELAVVATLADTARVQAVIIETQQAQILDLNASLGDAREIMRDLRMDLAMANEGRQEDQAEIRQLRATIAAGLEATKPSRGPWCTSRCPAIGVDYNASNGGVLAGVDVPITRYVRAGVRWQVIQ